MNLQYSKIGSVEIRTIEECTELVQALTKAIRFGWINFHPDTGKLNIDTVLEEIDDVMSVCVELKNTIHDSVSKNLVHTKVL